ncbi:hypothetical protein QT381_13470 [Galbitalea sp. SE-J8]|uniref:hypothetical protein n=1 Tax=Galbitalea sp. SE-J8 TaxID=3054952 RepID=UPI00259CB970|nr:hypothetical protein [Galbitalea sp. SE-J8]MDM4764019.1 hypothetical protein [Galbitalea sp. SE-J8]
MDFLRGVAALESLSEAFASLRPVVGELSLMAHRGVRGRRLGAGGRCAIPLIDVDERTGAEVDCSGFPRAFRFCIRIRVEFVAFRDRRPAAARPRRARIGVRGRHVDAAPVEDLAANGVGDPASSTVSFTPSASVMASLAIQSPARRAREA